MIPIMVALIFSQIAPLVDSYCISSTLGEDALSAMSTVNPVYYLFNVIGSLAGIGGGIGIAKASGSGDKYTGGRVFTRTMIWMSVSAIVISALCIIFLDPMLNILSATEENYGYAKEYLMVLIPGMVFYVIQYALTYILTDDNDASLSMIGGIVSGIVNVIIDMVGMFILHQGIWVAALGTVVGMLSGCLVFLFHRRKKDRICRLTKKRRDIPDIRLFEIVSPGMPEGVQNILFVVQILQSNYILSESIGTSGLGNAAVIENLELISTIIIAGICESVLPLFASYYGEGNKDITRMIKMRTIILGELIIIPFVISLLVYPEWLLLVFSIDEPLMMDTLPRAIRIVAIAQLANMINAIFISYLQSTDNEKKATISFFIGRAVQILVMMLMAKKLPHDAPWVGLFAGYTVVFLYFVIFCRQFKDFFVKKKKNILMIQKGRSDSDTIRRCNEEAGEYLAENERDLLWEKMLCPFEKALDKEAGYMCSFMIIKKDDGHRSVILRYDSRKDILGEEGEMDQGDEKIGTIFGECIRSEFNYVRRMMINFE